MGGINFCCFHTGKLVITGIRTMAQIDDVVYPTLIELELYTRKKWVTCRKTQVMEDSQVYRSIHYLIEVNIATPTDRKRLLQNITTDQVLAMREVAKRLTNGHINPLRRDARLFQSRRLMLRTLPSPRVSVERKKRLIRQYHSVIMKSVYLIQTILDEVITVTEA